jgi:glycerol uptake facilitator-like aquaporin
MKSSLAQRTAAECLGTAFLLAAVVGSGIMAAKLAGGNGALALLCNTIPTGAILTVLILTLGPVSGAHFNPAVSLAAALRGDMTARATALYIGAQLTGAVAGVWAAHLMFELPVLQISLTTRTGFGQWLAEAIATFGLLLTILGCSARSPAAVPYAVGLYITSHLGLLVHGFDILRQSGRHHRAIAIGHFCRHSTGGRDCLYRRTASRHARRCRAQPLVLVERGGLRFSNCG